MLKCFIKIQFGNNFTFHVILKSLRQLADEDKSQLVNKHSFLLLLLGGQKLLNTNHMPGTVYGTRALQDHKIRGNLEFLE